MYPGDSLKPVGRRLPESRHSRFHRIPPLAGQAIFLHQDLAKKPLVFLMKLDGP
jgi:hypothetical protein